VVIHTVIRGYLTLLTWLVRLRVWELGKREEGSCSSAAGRCNGDRRELRMTVQPRAGSGIFRQLVRDGESSILTLIM